ncbi:MAG: insulinase family protein [Akkermansia sp.]|nr:insulinase family protein [Akkermansia sp.]
MNYKTILPLIALSMGMPVVHAQETTEATIVQPAADEQMTLHEDALLTKGELPNGIKYIIRPTAEPQGRGCLRLFVNTGSLNEQEHEKGISHLLEHLVFNGSRNHKRNELIPAMQQRGLGFGGDVNAYTSLLHTVYMLNLPNLNEDTVDFAFTVLRDFADGATLTDDAIDHERGIVRSELYARDSASYRSSIAMLRHCAPGMKLADYLPIGTEEVIMGAPYEVFRNYYKTHYVARNMTVVVTGDFKPETAVAWVEKHFSSMPDAPLPARPDLGTLKMDGPADIVLHNPENEATSIVLSVANPYEEKPDTMQQRIDDMPLQLACAMVNQRLARMARQSDSPFMGASVGEEPMYESVTPFNLSLTTQHDNWKAAMEAALQELRRACIYGFSDSELNEIVAATVAAHERQIGSWATVDAAAMAERIIDCLDNKEVQTDPQESQRSFNMALDVVRKNPDICRQALEKAFDTTRVRLAMNGAKVQDNEPSDLRDVFNMVMQQEVSAPEADELPPFAYDQLGEPGSITEQAVIEDLGITTLTLSNGIRINLKPVDFQKGSIKIGAYIDGGSIRMLDKPGLAAMAGSVMQQGGLEAHDLTELEKIMAGEHVSLNFGMGADRIRLSGSTTAEDFELQCKLLVAGILHPGYRKDGEERLRRGLASMYNRFETTSNGAFSYQAPRHIYGSDPRFITPTREQMEQCTAEQVKEALTPWLQKGAMEISVVGDFKVEDVIPALLRTFGSMPQRNTEFTALTDEETDVSQARWGMRTFLPYTTELDKTIVTQIRPCGDGMDHRRNRRMQVLANITREKLFDGIRAQLGETYSPSVRFAPNSDLKNAATITTSSEGVVGNRVKVTTAMDAILVDLGQGKITQEDLDCALRPYISRTVKGLRSMGYWENALASLQSDPRQLPLLRDLVADVKSITLEEIQQLAREVFGSQDNINYFFTMPAGAVPAEEPEQDAAPEVEEAAEEAKPTEEACEAPEADEAVACGTPAYTIITSATTMADPEWAAVVSNLANKHEGAVICPLQELTENSIAAALRRNQARYAACVLRPQEIGRVLVNNLHRAARRVDDDVWGDCIWGIITGHTAEDAMRIAKADEPLTIKRLLASTNLDHNRFEHSCCITDWTNAPVREQSGYTEPTTTTYPVGEQDPLLDIFTDQLATQKPQFVVSSSHATPFNLEMPFSRGLIFSYNNRFHKLPGHQFSQMGSAIGEAMGGQEAGIAAMADKKEAVEPDGETRVWLAAGNCLFGNANHSQNSMCVTALSAYTCNQVVGYTVPSWYGEGGWGTLGTFFGNTSGTSLAEAWFLNNQFLLNRTQQLNPKLLNVQFNGSEFSPGEFIPQFMRQDIRPEQNQVKDMFGLVHDRDVVAFFGDPAWRAQLDESHAQAPYSIAWEGEKSFTITANYDTKDRCAVWFPSAATGKDATGCDAPGAVFTNDFILFPTLNLKKGESLKVNIN